MTVYGFCGVNSFVDRYFASVDYLNEFQEKTLIRFLTLYIRWIQLTLTVDVVLLSLSAGGCKSNDDLSVGTWDHVDAAVLRSWLNMSASAEEEKNMNCFYDVDGYVS